MSVVDPTVTEANLGSVLKGERRNLGLDLREYGQRVGVSGPTIGRIEQGKANLRPGNKKKVADYLGLQVTDIWPVASEEDSE